MAEVTALGGEAPAEVTELGGEAPAEAVAPVAETKVATAEAVAAEKAAAEKAAGEKPTDKPKDGDADKGQKEGAPETYADFTVPEGMEIDATKLGEFAPLAKELNLDQAGAQKFVDLFAKYQQEAVETQTSQWAKTTEEWRKSSADDKEFGGAKFEASIASSTKAIDTIMGKEAPAFKELLNSTQMGNHPEVIRFMHRVAVAIGDDKLHFGKGGEAPRDPAKAMYPTMNK